MTRNTKLYLLLQFVLMFVLISNSINAQKLTPTDQNSDVSFQIVNHLIGSSTVTGHFKGIAGAIMFDAKAPEKATFDVTVNVKTIKTGVSMRDNDLQAEKYFNTAKYPVIRIKSIKIAGANGKYTMTAQLTMKGVTKTVTIPFSAVQKTGGYMFTGQFKLNRMDYHVGPDNAIDKQLTVSLSVFAKG